MTEWTTHTPAFDGDAPEGVGLDTHYIECGSGDGNWFEIEVGTNGPRWGSVTEYRYRPHVAVLPPPATYEQVKAWHIANGSPVPPKPINYEAWRPALAAWMTDGTLGDPKVPLSQWDKERAQGLIAAMRVAINSPACMEDIKG